MNIRFQYFLAGANKNHDILVNIRIARVVFSMGDADPNAWQKYHDLMTNNRILLGTMVP